MTRFLSEALQADEPQFRLGLRQLEHANGNASHDIRLSTQILHETQAKLRQLGLDPLDTTADELYQALQRKVSIDDQRLTKYFRSEAATHISAEGDLMAGMVRAIQSLPDSTKSFALKAAVLKKLLETNAPKKAMRRLGYRSIKSFLKHEPPALCLAAAWLSEGEQWQKRFLSSYKILKSKDFEMRKIMLIEPTTKQWRSLAQEVIASQHHTIISFKEFGAIIFLPTEETHVPPGSVTVTLALALHELNEIRASSTFLKLNQVRPDFGKIVSQVATSEPQLSTTFLDQPLPWNLIQRYYARIKDTIKEAVFEPYVELQDMDWNTIEQQLIAIDPDLSFWDKSAYLGLIDNHRAPVSMNIVDVALNYANQLPFEKRITQYFQRSLWHELLLRYLRHEPVEEAVLNELQPEFAAEEPALI